MSNAGFIKLLMGAGGVVLGGRILTVVLQFIFNLLLTKVLMKESVGDFFLIFSFISFFSILVSFGAGNVVLKQFSDRITDNQATSTTFLLRAFIKLNLVTTLLTSVLFFLLYLTDVFKSFNLELEPKQLVIVVVCFWSVGLQAILNDLFRAFGRFSLLVIAGGMLVGVFNMLVLLFSYFYDSFIGLNGVLYLVAINNTVMVFISLYLSWRLCSRFDSGKIIKQESEDQGKIQSKSRIKSWRLKQHLVVSLIQQSTPSLINRLALYLTVAADIWLVSAFYGNLNVADYGIASKLAISLSILLLVANALVPHFYNEIKKQGRLVVESFFRLISTLIAFPTVSLFLVFVFYSDLIVYSLFGDTYADVSTFFLILVTGQLANVLLGSSSYVLVMHGMNFHLMKVSIFTAASSILLALIFVNFNYSAYFIAWAFVLSAICRHITVYLLAKKLCNINTAIFFSPHHLLSSYRQLVALKITGRR